VQLEARANVSVSYPVCFTERAFDPSNATLRDAIARLEPRRTHRLVAVVDDGLAAAMPELVAGLVGYVDAHGDALALAAPPMLVPGGERSKNDPAVLARVQRALHEARLDRHSFVVAVGGGAVLDMAGYAAAITHRGVRLVRVPSTVLSQADSAVGVKNGVNAFGTKNYFGTFAAPFAVVEDASLLDALPARERVAGMAEALKVALLREPDFFAWIVRHAPALVAGERLLVRRLVERSASLHLDHIERCGDPFELGSGRPLDFGHWSAHKLESLSEHRVRHGEGVAIGIALDTIYARDAGLCSDSLVDAVLGAIRSLRLPLWDAALSERGRLLAGLDEFREHLGGELAIPLLREPGRPIDVKTMDPARVGRALDRLEEIASCV
jgi:3-dehydroquinate synthase